MAGPITRALGDLVLKAVDAGVSDKQGVRVPLILAGGPRNAVAAILKEIKTAQPGTSDKDAKEIAEAALESVINAGCVSDEECRLPQYDKKGHANGTQAGRGLIARWDRAPWRSTDAAPDQGQADVSQPKSLKLLATELVARAQLPEVKAGTLRELAIRFDHKEFLPSVADVREFLI